jgi:signal transduction histidine kinase
LESLLAQLQEGVVVAGPDGKVLLINPAAMRLLGLSRGDAEDSSTLVGLPVEQCVSQHELQRMLIPAASSVDSGALRTDSANVTPDVREVQIQGSNEKGGETFVLAQASDIVLPDFEKEGQLSKPGDQRPAGRMLVLTNISELTRAVRMKMDFASNASHELRTPLSAIRAAIETLGNTNLVEDSEAAKRFLGVIDRHSARMEQMVSDLLDLSRIESSQSRFKPQVVNLQSLLSDLHGRYLERLQAGKLDWVSDIEPDSRLIEANPYLLRVVLENLLDNAIKFTGEGGRIAVSCRWSQRNGKEGEVVAIAVLDNGCGIAPEEQDRVFERFYQVERARSGEGSVRADLRGTGLGLSIVKHAVVAMEGSVDLESTPGQGTRVTLTIPQPAR